MTKGMIESTNTKPCRVLILSRPQNLHNEKNLADVEVECMGLDDDQLVKFIKSETSSIEFVEHLQRHPDVWETSHTPVVANILVFLFKTRKEDFVSEHCSLNTCSLYSKMSLDIWERYIVKTSSECRRDQIFEALQELAFRALDIGQVLIDQHLVRDVSQDRQTSDVFQDSGFLLLKRECAYYQFPHLTFQEFFAGHYMAHSLLSRDERRKQKAVEFLKENKYCANFKQVFSFMIQALTLKNREEGYQEVESIINDGPIALGYQQHLRLSMELLEASLSASRPEDRERMLDSTGVLERAFAWIESREFYSDALAVTLSASANNPVIDRIFGTSCIDTTEEFVDLFVQIARAARYVPDQWEKVINTLKADLAVKNGTKGVSCIISLIRAIPEQRHNLLELYWEYINHNNNTTMIAALSYLPDIVRMMPSNFENLFERFKSRLFDDSDVLEVAYLYLDFPRLAQLMPDLWQEILDILKKALFNDLFEQLELDQLGRFVEFVPESEGHVMELLRESSSLDNQSKRSMARSCLSLTRAMPENSTEIVEILWTLCEDEDVCNVARAHVVHIMLSWGEETDSAVDTLLRLSDSEPQRLSSSLVRLVAIAYELVEETAEGVDRLLSSLSRYDLMTIWQQVVLCIRDLIGTKTANEMGLHWLHFKTVKGLELPEVEDQELHMMMANISSDPNKIAVTSAKLMLIPQFPMRNFNLPMALAKLATCCPEYEEDLFNSINGLTLDEYEGVANKACVHMFSMLERLPSKTERVMNSLQEFKHPLDCFELLRMRESVSLDTLFKAYMMSGSDLLVFFIAWESFDTPITTEPMGKGGFRLVVQTASNNKKKYKFQTVEEAQVFASSFDECIEVVFSDVASLVPRLDSRKREQSKNTLFAYLRERLTTSSL